MIMDAAREARNTAGPATSYGWPRRSISCRADDEVAREGAGGVGGLDERSVKQRGRDRIHADPVADPFKGEASGHLQHTALRLVVSGCVGVDDRGADRSDVDDRSAATLADHLPASGLRS